MIHPRIPVLVHQGRNDEALISVLKDAHRDTENEVVRMWVRLVAGAGRPKEHAGEESTSNSIQIERFILCKD